MANQLTVCFVGCGDFARCFVPLFQAHPVVKKVYVCDLKKERANIYAKDFGVETVDSFDAALQQSDINCIANFTQRHLHGPIVKAALMHGKHVYSSVPMAASVEECAEIIDLVKQTGLIYMMGETCFYYPCAMFCREKQKDGEMGHFVYGESQYYHDISHFPPDFRADKKSAGVPPLFYSSHSTAMILSAADSYVTRVTAFGYHDQEPDGYYRRDVNQWANEFSNEYTLMQLANGGIARVNECRRIAFKAPSSCIQSFYGTNASYQFQNARHLLYKKTPDGVSLEDVSSFVNPESMTLNRYEKDFMLRTANHEWQADSFAPVQAAERAKLPASFIGLRNGHMASHQILVNDFCTAVQSGKQPVLNAWTAARYTLPGLIAHESALRNGEPINVPDFGTCCL